MHYSVGFVNFSLRFFVELDLTPTQRTGHLSFFLLKLKPASETLHMEDVVLCAVQLSDLSFHSKVLLADGTRRSFLGFVGDETKAAFLTGKKPVQLALNFFD